MQAKGGERHATLRSAAQIRARPDRALGRHPRRRAGAARRGHRPFDYIAIADLSQPAQVNLELVGAGLSRRYGRDIRNINWMDLVPPELGAAATRARDRIRSVPCGAYYKFTASRDGAPPVTTETLALPLRQRIAAVPSAGIALTRDVGGAGRPPAGWFAPPARLEHFFGELLDLGAGVPDPTEHASR